LASFLVDVFTGEEMTVEREQIIRDTAGNLLACQELLKSGNLSECNRAWLEQQAENNRTILSAFGVDAIVAKNGTEEITIFKSSPDSLQSETGNSS